MIKVRRPIQIILSLVSLIFFCAACTDQRTTEPLPEKKRSLSELENRLTDIDENLTQLANYNLRRGTGASGYRSIKHAKPNNTEWIRIELGKKIQIDQVVLVPALFRDAKAGPQSESFPSALRILAGTADSTNVVATLSKEDEIQPRIAPLVIPIEPIRASWVCVEATVLTTRLLSNLYHLQLSEILVFSGMDNVALHKNVTVPHPIKRPGGARNQRYLTDGFTPYVMDAALGNKSITSVFPIKTTTPPPSITIDLNHIRLIDHINIHAANMSLAIPMTNFNIWSVPQHLRVTGANFEDFSDETTLFECKQRSIYDAGPILMHSFPETRCRYVRLTVLDHRPVASISNEASSMAFSEIEVFSNGKNIAQGARVSAQGISSTRTTLARITDGRNYFGKIIPLKQWMNQLSKRHDLEKERPVVINAIVIKYAFQKKLLRIMIWLVAVLATATVITLLIARTVRHRAIIKTRERIAANLHDELGANLHAIGILGDLAKQEIDDADATEQWTALTHFINETRKLTKQTVNTARHCTNMLEAGDLHENVAHEMKRVGTRLLADLQHNRSFAGTEQLNTLPPNRRIGLYLFYKECLTNIIRHARATTVTTRLTAEKNLIKLSVTDNGTGVKEAPASLKRRARLINAKLTVTQPYAGGTKVTLQIRNRRFPFIKK